MAEEDAPPRLLSMAEIGRRAAEIPKNSAEYLICRGIKPPLLPDEPVARDLRRASLERRK
jgi:hypothetical protein